MRYLLAAGAVLLLAACAPLADGAAGACRFEAQEPRSTAALARIASDRGLGGSGVSSEERGLGGSGIRAGIIGVVTGFGSICVNGYRVELDERSRVTVEGVPATPADIHLGQLVVVEAETGGGALRAASVDVRLAAVGPVAEVGADGRTLTVLGQIVRVAGLADAALDGIAPGDWVAVSGLRGADAAIEGTSVVKLPTRGARAMVAGVLHGARPSGPDADNAGRSSLGLGGLAVTAAAFNPGDAVVVEGPADGTRMTVETVRPQLDTRFTEAVRDLSVQTFLSSDRVMGLRIAPARLRAFAAGGSPVQLEGRLHLGTTFVPERVTVPALPRDSQRPVTGVLVGRGRGGIVAPAPPGIARPIDVPPVEALSRPPSQP